jgi:hypothetical protein
LGVKWAYEVITIAMKEALECNFPGVSVNVGDVKERLLKIERCDPIEVAILSRLLHPSRASWQLVVAWPMGK